MGERFIRPRKWAFYILLGAISLTNISFSNEHTASPKEALMLRRITEYWKDGDYATVKRQIMDFLEKNPDTSLYDHLNAMLGDLYFQDRNFRQALATYDLIGDFDIREKTFFNHLQAHFEMRDYLSVIEKSERYLRERQGAGTEQPVKVRYLLAEACFRHALKCKDMEQKAFYLKMAKPHYKILTQTKYNDRVLFPLAEIHRLLREDERAVSLYLKLADKYPEHRERFLFQCGILQIKADRKKAAKTFATVYELGGKRSRLAAFNRLILLYQMENYEEFLVFHEKVIEQMPQQKVPLLQFYEGRCHYSLGDYAQAVLPIENFIMQVKGRSRELKTAHLLLVNCSRYLKDIDLLERTLYSFKTAFPKDAEVPKVLMIHSQMCRESGNFTQALTDLRMLCNDYPAYEDAEGVLYDLGLMLSQTDQWIEARETFLAFLEQYPASERKKSAWRHLLNCSIEELKSPAQENSNETKALFVSILEEALHQEKVFSAKEKEQYALVKMKCQCDLERYEEVIPLLSQYINDVVEPGNLAEAHLLMAICQQKMNSDLSQFIQHGEKALSYNPRIPEHSVLHLELYNAYLSKGLSASDPGNQDYFFDFAADHLFASNAWKQRMIKLDNYLWLVNHYYQAAKLGAPDDFERAKILFHDLLGIEEGKDTLNIFSDSLYLENEVLKFAHLLEINNQQKERVSVLEKLVHRQEEQNQLPWKLKKRAILELAKAYEADSRYQDALNSYQFLVRNKGNFSSMVTNTASLHLAKLEYSLLNPQELVSENPAMISILHTLKDLQIQKRLQAEPLHLEAGLQYAEIRANLSAGGDDSQDAHFFYNRMYEDFTSLEDPISAEYSDLRESNPKKNAIFTAYMKYLDSKMLKIEAMTARAEKKFDKASEYEERALSLLDELLIDEDSLKPYLLDRVHRLKAEVTKRL